MDFIEAMSLMKNGEKIRKSTWKENRYIYMSDECSGFSNEKNNYLYQISFSRDEFLANDWEVFDGVEFHSGLIVKDEDDGTYGIILDVYEETVHVLNENGLVEELWKDDIEIVSDEKDTLYKPLLNKLQGYSKEEGE